MVTRKLERRMTGDEYKEAIRAIGFTNQIAAGAWLNGVSGKTANRYAKEGPPLAITRLLRLMIAASITHDEWKSHT